MGKVNVCAPLCCLGKVLKLWPIVGSDAFENILEMLAILSVKHLHCALYGCFGLAGNPHSDVVVSYSLNEGEDHSLLPISLAYYGIGLPVPQLDTLLNNAGTLFDTGSFGTLVDTALSLSVTAFQHIRHLEER